MLRYLQVFEGLKVWIDVLTPKQALFFAPLRDMLDKSGHQVFVTTRVYREAVQTLQRKRVLFQIVGEHGGGSREGKLLASAARIRSLTSIISRLHPNVALSFSSVEASRVAFGLGIPHVAVNDSPHSWMVARLTVPLSRYVGSPWIIKPRVWRAFGARPDGIFSYRALDPAAWLKRFKPNPRVVRELGLNEKEPILVLRTEEAFASYIAQLSSDKEPVIGPVIDEIISSGLDVQIVVSTRYGQQAPVLKKRFGENVTVIEKIIDATSLLHYSAAFIGSGGTMTVEAALLGRPAISCFPGEKPLYIRYLERKGLVKTIQRPRKVVAEIQRMLDSSDYLRKQKARGQSLLSWMEDPVPKIFRFVNMASRGEF